MAPKPRSSVLSFDSGPPLDSIYVKQDDEKELRFDHVEFTDTDKSLSSGPAFLNRNKTERGRLQGLTRAMSRTHVKEADNGVVNGAASIAHKVKKWMVNEGRNRLFMVFWIVLHLIGFAFSLVHYDLKDNLVGARSVFGFTFVAARGSAQVLHIDAIFILLPVCRNLVSLLRRTPLNSVIPFDKNVTFHSEGQAFMTGLLAHLPAEQIGWAIVFFSLVHTIAHMRNFAVLAIVSKTGFKGFLEYNFVTGPGLTGWLMWAALGIMVWFAMEKRRKANFERFWYSHHLFIVFFLGWQLHGMFCMIQPDRPPFCSAGTIGVFWKYWLPGGIVWITERVLREVRARHVTYISKVIQHPSKVLELQIKKEHTTVRAGQYIFINCPEISYFQYHPFTLTSAPEEDYLSVHMRCVGDWTNAFAASVGANFGYRKEKGASSEGTVLEPPVGKVMPRVMIDGPFGSASEDFAKFETVLLVGAGIGVTPFASILKSIWYRMNKFSQDKATRLSKVYFVWVIRDFGSAEWFHSLLQAVEAEDLEGRIEIHIYLTAKIDEDKMNNLLIQDVGTEKDTITKLRSPTHFGRPNWDRVFESIANKHPDTDCGVFFCGPPVLSKSLHQMSNKYTSPMGCRFFFGKENF